MRYYTLLTILTYLSMLLGTTAVGTSEDQAVYVIMLGVGCLLAWPSDRRGRATPMPIRVLVLGALFGYTLVNLLLLGSNPILTLGHLVTFAMMVKATAVKGPRDYLQIYLLSLCSVIVGGYFANHVVFAVVLLGFLASTGWAMMLLVMTSQARVWVRSSPRDYAPRTLDLGRLPGLDQAIGVSRRRFLGGALVYLPALLAPAVLVFVLTPRSAIQRFGLPAGGEQSITGFSERVQLGEMAHILENSAPVMRIELVNPRTKEPIEQPRIALLWRGITLNSYAPHHGKWEWRKTVSDLDAYEPMRDLDIGPLNPIQQNISLEPIDSSCLFALAPVLRLRSAHLGRVSVYRDDGSLRVNDPPSGIREYTVISARQPLPTGDTPNIRYLTVPAGAIGDTLHRLAESIAPKSEYLTPFSKAQAIVTYCHSGRLGYSLAYRGTPGAEPVTDFLTTTREGHCELFASAMALMLRTLGVNSRIVNGFRGGEWNPMGKFIQVRQQDAHSWVEAFIPGQGWRAFDPTPGASMSIADRRRSIGGFFAQLYDFLKWAWLQHVLQYDQAQQRDVLASVTDLVAIGRTSVVWNRVALAQAWTAWRDIARDAARHIGLSGRAVNAFVTVLTVLVAALLISGAGFALRHVSRRQRRLVAPIGFYQDLLRALARLGFARAATQTPMEFAVHVAGAAPDTLDVVPWITEQYYRVRFGRFEPDLSLRARLRDAVDRVSGLTPAALRRPPQPAADD